jgi:hypothetical protein
VWIRWPIGYFLWHTGKDIPNLLAQLDRELLCGPRLALVGVNFVERPVVARLGNCQPQRRLPAWIGCAWLLLVVSSVIQNDIKPLRDDRFTGWRV